MNCPKTICLLLCAAASAYAGNPFEFHLNPAEISTQHERTSGFNLPAFRLLPAGELMPSA